MSDYDAQRAAWAEIDARIAGTRRLGWWQIVARLRDWRRRRAIRRYAKAVMMFPPTREWFTLDAKP